MKPRTRIVWNCLLGCSLFACAAALTACGSEEPKPTQNPVENGTTPTTASNPQSPMSDGPPTGAPSTNP